MRDQHERVFLYTDIQTRTQQQQHTYVQRGEIKIIFTLKPKIFLFHKESISKLKKKEYTTINQNVDTLLVRSDVLVLCASEYADKRRLNKQRGDLLKLALFISSLSTPHNSHDSVLLVFFFFFNLFSSFTRRCDSRLFVLLSFQLNV